MDIMIKLYIYFLYLINIVYGYGLMILYRPKDITNACAFSNRLRFDLSFGMGMSDTTTVVFRTMNNFDYECLVEITVDSPQSHLIVVVRYPTNIYTNCVMNPDAIILIKNNHCIRICDFISSDAVAKYFLFTIRQRALFRFTSNSSINTYLKANFYQVTVTAARQKPKGGCYKGNETICSVGDVDYCFTSGVVCDGIKNCGVDDWFDERKSECFMPTQTLGIAPVLALLAFIACVLIAGGHLLLRCLPPLANSFFIFNANEDNRLCIDPKLIPSGNPPEIAIAKRTSIIPVSSSSSSEEAVEVEVKDSQVYEEPRTVEKTVGIQEKWIAGKGLKPPSQNVFKSVSERVHNKIKNVTGYRKSLKTKIPDEQIQ